MARTYGYHEPKVNHAVVSAVRTAFQRSRTSPSQWKHRVNEGRIDPRNVWRQQATDRTDIFRDRTAPGATKVNLHILVDGSGSMDSTDQQVPGSEVKTTRIQAAMDITATLFDAFHRQPQVRLSITLHNTVAMNGNVALWPIVTNGQGRQYIGFMGKAVGGGNGDGYAIKAIGEKVRHSHRKGEVDLLIIVSDGLPSWLADRAYQNAHADGVGLVYNVVEDLRKTGVQVMSIAIAPNPNQQEMYGKEGVIPFDGDWNHLAVGIATVLGQTLTTAAKGRRR
jgi:hypothetical protein